MDFLEVKDNKILWTKRDSEITVLTFWQKPFDCECCGKQTHLTSQLRGGVHHPVCEGCYVELHAYHIAITAEVKSLMEAEP